MTLDFPALERTAKTTNGTPSGASGARQVEHKNCGLEKIISPIVATTGIYIFKEGLI